MNFITINIGYDDEKLIICPKNSTIFPEDVAICFTEHNEVRALMRLFSKLNATLRFLWYKEFGPINSNDTTLLSALATGEIDMAPYPLVFRYCKVSHVHCKDGVPQRVTVKICR